MLLLREHYRSEDIAAALRHALSYGANEHHAIARILESRATPRTLAEYVSDEATRRAERSLGRAETSVRDLSEYDRLPIVGRRTTEEKEDRPWDETETDPTTETCSRGCASRWRCWA